MGKFYDIDPETCTKEELKAAITKCAEMQDYYHTMEQSCKTFINSMYGAIGSNLYNCSNVDIAESITLQGQNLIKFSVRVIDGYFKNVWPSSYDAHEKVGMYMKTKFPEFNYDKFINDTAVKVLRLPYVNGVETLQIYGDTDSAYISIQPITDLYEIPLEMQTEFILGMHSEVLEGYLDMAFDKYAEKFNCPANKEKLELEKTARTVLMLSKKNYFMDISWTDSGSHIKPLHKLVYKGFDVVKGSTPEYCRTSMKDFIKFVMGKLDEGIKPTYSSIVSKINGYKSGFALQPPVAISKSCKISDYEKFILNDKDPSGLKFTTVNSGGVDKEITCPQHVKAAGMYNNMLFNKAKKYKSKYSFIRTGDKVRFYYTNGVDSEGKRMVFGYPDGQFPFEFAPKMDMEYQFEKMILSPLNRIVNAIGYESIPCTMMYVNALF